MKKLKELLSDRLPSKRAFWIAVAIAVVAGLLITSVMTCGFENLVAMLKAEVMQNG